MSFLSVSLVLLERLGRPRIQQLDANLVRFVQLTSCWEKFALPIKIQYAEDVRVQLGKVSSLRATLLLMLFAYHAHLVSVFHQSPIQMNAQHVRSAPRDKLWRRSAPHRPIQCVPRFLLVQICLGSNDTRVPLLAPLLC